MITSRVKTKHFSIVGLRVVAREFLVPGGIYGNFL